MGFQSFVDKNGSDRLFSDRFTTSTNNMNQTNMGFMGTSNYNGGLGNGRQDLNSNSNPRVVHVVKVDSSSSNLLWNAFLVISIVIFLCYLYYSFTSSVSPKLESHASAFVSDVTSDEAAAASIRSDGTVKVVLLHANWCDHCKVMMQAFNSAAENLRSVRWIRVEQTYASAILKANHQVKGFPTMFGIKADGQVVMYGEREPRTQAALVHWANELSNSKGLVIEVLDSEAVHSIQEPGQQKEQKEQDYKEQNQAQQNVTSANPLVNQTLHVVSQSVEPVKPMVSQTVEPVVSQTVEPMVSQTVEPVVSQTVEPVVSQTVEPVVSQTVEPVVSQTVEPVPQALATLSAQFLSTLPKQDSPKLSTLSETTVAT
jgi:thiol-disulfide isomerase/thioredoxin